MLYITTTMGSIVTGSLKAQYSLLVGSCSMRENVPDDLECTSVMEIDHLKATVNITCQNPDPGVFDVTDCLTALDV